MITGREPADMTIASQETPARIPSAVQPLVGRCLFCARDQQLKIGCQKQRWKVCREHFMVTCPVCGHEAFWLENMKSGSYYACFSLACNWRSTFLPNADLRGGNAVPSK